MILFFDTETTGKANFKAAPDHSSQPRLVQLGALLCEETGVERAVIDLIIRPEGWTIPDEAAGIHGISTELATAAGVSIVSAMLLFSELLACAKLIVAHNIDFDSLIIESELKRRGTDGARQCFEKFRATPSVCTMRATTPICKLPGQYKDFKWPKLTEAYQHFFGGLPADSHTAIADARACARIWFHLQTLEINRDSNAVVI